MKMSWYNIGMDAGTIVGYFIKNHLLILSIALLTQASKIGRINRWFLILRSKND